MGQQPDGHRREAHDHHRNEEGTLASDEIAACSDNKGTERTHGEPCAECRQTGEEGCRLVAEWIKQGTEEDRQAPVEEEVVPKTVPSDAATTTSRIFEAVSWGFPWATDELAIVMSASELAAP